MAKVSKSQPRLEHALNGNEAILMMIELCFPLCTGIYEIFSGQKCTVGTQEHPLPGTDTVGRQTLCV